MTNPTYEKHRRMVEKYNAVIDAWNAGMASDDVMDAASADMQASRMAQFYSALARAKGAP